MTGLERMRDMSKKRRPEWKVRMRKSNYASNLGQDVPMVYHPRNYTLEDIIALMDAHLSLPVTKENLEMCVKMFMDQVENLLLEGSIVNLPIGRLTPAVTGAWEYQRRFDENVRAQNKAVVNYAMGPRLTRLLANPLLHDMHIGTLHRLRIDEVKDHASGIVNRRLTPGGIITVRGRMLLMNGDDPRRGLHLLRAGTQEEVLHLKPEDFALCTRTRIVTQVPATLPPGTYLLQAVSQCTTNPKPLREAAEYTLDRDLTVGEEENADSPAPEGGNLAE